MALFLAFLINAAILVPGIGNIFMVPATSPLPISATRTPLLSPLLGTSIASVLFAVVPCWPQGRTPLQTGTLAGQIVMEGFLDISLPPWIRRMITRLLAILPAVIVTAMYGEHGIGALIILSQVILALATLLGGGAAGALHVIEGEDGSLCEPSRHRRAGLDDRDRHRRTQWLVADRPGAAVAGMRVLLTFLVLSAPPLAAQDTTAKPIDTDRPDFTDGTHTLAAGRFQLETGYTYQQARGMDRWPYPLRARSARSCRRLVACRTTGR